MGLPGPELGLQLTGSLLLAATLRGTALVSLALVAAFFLRRSTGAVRHILWSVTMAGLLAMPVLSGLLPSLPLPLPTVFSAEPERLPVAVSPQLAAPGPAAVEPLATVRGAASTREPVARRVPSRSVGASAAIAVVGVWILGAGAVATALMLGLLRAWRTATRAAIVRDPAWRAELEQIRRRLRIRRPVRLVSSHGISTPLTGGIVRPVVLLPEQARHWDAVRRRLVLQHELVHVRRLDALRQLLTRLAVCAYWFHPLVWVASRMAMLAREQACDEEVIALGNLPSVYARHLLELSAGARSPGAALAMIERPHLEKRLMAILELRRRGASTMLGVATSLGMVIAALSVAAAQPQEAAPLPPLPPPSIPALVRLPVQVSTLAPLSAPLGAVPPSGLATPIAPPAIALLPIAPLPIAPPAKPQVPTGGRSCQLEGMHGNFSGTWSTRRDDTGATFVERFGNDNSDRVIQKHIGDLRLCMRVHGAVDLGSEGDRIGPVGEGGWLVMESELDGVVKRLEIASVDGGSEAGWSVDGQEQAFDQHARAWRDQVLGVLADYWEISQLRGQVSSLRGQISSTKGQVSSMRGQISSARGHVSSLRGRISSHRGRISSLNVATHATRDEETQSRLAEEIREAEAVIREIESEIDEYDVEGRAAEIERLIEEFDVDSSVDEIEREIENYDLAAKVAEIERQIEAFDLESRIAEIEQQIEALDVDGKVRELEQRIEALDVKRRVEQIQASLEPKLATLRQLVPVS